MSVARLADRTRATKDLPHIRDLHVVGPGNRRKISRRIRKVTHRAGCGSQSENRPPYDETRAFDSMGVAQLLR